MKRILRKVKGFLLTVRDSMLLRYRISSCSGTLEKPLKILNSKYINIGSRVRIKKGARIECYDSFYIDDVLDSLVFMNVWGLVSEVPRCAERWFQRALRDRCSE